ncbi:MoaD/ThiS family protein [Pseudomarimonas arenosa]|uniref:MoaD/ThiS family protein n=1 Tax=Pseudomarimonas arenosa TaxID=2774145 RepID=A0AAW3ZS39_9GAMM|nr:MoaD/ThiS family protein [Pseudomarimonas arenosa]MBD8528259.1 MoaD/ThiS family protein [Pseudomarimonas arenosa]
MATVTLTGHLLSFFPALKGQSLSVEASSVAQLLAALEQRAPGFAFYVCDEAGRLRPHVNIFIDGQRIVDRRALSDPLNENAEVFILQALSGG